MSQTETSSTKLNEGASAEDVIIQLPKGVAVRRYRDTDVQALSRHANNAKVWANLRNRMPSPYTEKDAKEWIARNQDPANHFRSGTWTTATGSEGPLIPNNYSITLNDEVVGAIGLDFEDPSDVYFRTAEIGYWLGEEHWGKGIMGAVVPAFVEWTWKTFGVLVRLNAEIYERNKGSRRCLEKAGFKEEGRRKWALVKNGKLENDVMMGLLRPGMEDEE